MFVQLLNLNWLTAKLTGTGYNLHREKFPLGSFSVHSEITLQLQILIFSAGVQTVGVCE